MPRGFSRLSLVRFGYSIQLSELDGVHEFNARLADINDAGFAGLHGLSLDVNSLSGGLGISLGLIVSADASLESLTAGRHADVLNADVDALGDNADTNALVHDDTDGVLGHVEDSAGLAVVELVGHTSLDGTIGNNINVVTLLVVHEVLAQWRNTVLSECFAEEISRASSKTETVGHLSFKPSKYLIQMKPNYQNL